MGRYAQLVIGPAGSGKSTYCETMQQHCENTGRTVHVVNLDPAAEEFKYSCTIGVGLPQISGILASAWGPLAGRKFSRSLSLLDFRYPESHIVGRRHRGRGAAVWPQRWPGLLLRVCAAYDSCGTPLALKLECYAFGARPLSSCAPLHLQCAGLSDSCSLRPSLA